MAPGPVLHGTIPTHAGSSASESHIVQQSSRTRGAAGHPPPPSPRVGTTPARAGSSCPSYRPGRRRWDHPRASREQDPAPSWSPCVTGSSPRVRGADLRLRTPGRPGGIIPARAGSRTAGTAPTPGRRNHPRACGEQGWRVRSVSVMWGSSPRVRGAALGVANALPAPRIIPARAGSSRRRNRPRSRPGDHPRACGEQMVHDADSSPSTGSSPRVRGAADDLAELRRLDGIIPARAGSRADAHLTEHRRGDHPRACGEQMSSLYTADADLGSSPRVRGADRLPRCRALPRGIIPARAGSSRRSCVPCLDLRDHPRACGEQLTSYSTT